MQSLKRLLPAPISPELREKIRHYACEAFLALDCSGVSRIDFLMDNKSGEVWVNEINTIPGSLAFYLWEATGISFEQLMDKLVELALKRKRTTDRKTFTYDQNIFSLGGGVKGAKGAKGSKF
jgi:D-alanine-D-alanine ligase